MGGGDEDPEVAARRRAFAEDRDRIAAEYLSDPSHRPSSIGRGVHHVALICRDVTETIRFYTQIVGFPLVEIFENRDYPGSSHFFLDIGNNNTLAFFDFPGHDHPDWLETIGNMQHLAVSVSPHDFEGAKRRLADAGVALVGPPEVAESIYFRDPNGAQIELTVDPLMEMMGSPLGQRD